MSKDIITPKNVHRPTGYSHAIKCDNTIYIFGQMALDEERKLVWVRYSDRVHGSKEL